MRDGKVRRVTFRNVPAFATHLDAQVEVPRPGHGDGGRGLWRHVLCDRRCGAARASAWRRTKRATLCAIGGDDQSGDAGTTAGGAPGECRHRGRQHRADFGASLRGGARIARIRWWSPPGRSTGRGRRPGPGLLDRSPCGTGTCAKMAVLHAKGQLRTLPGFRSRRHSGHDIHGAAARRDARRAVRRGGADALRTGMDYGVRAVCAWTPRIRFRTGLRWAIFGGRHR